MMEQGNHTGMQAKIDWERMAEAWAETYLQRTDLFAIQLRDGHYACIKSCVSPRLMRLHLQGTLTLGGYLLDRESRARQVILDADRADQFAQLRDLARALAGLAVPAYLETSRRGGHLRLFFAEPITGREARRFGLGLLRGYGLDRRIELYPKQEALGDGPGSLVRLPLGVHRRTGRRYGFVHPGGSSLGSWWAQMQILAHPETVPVAFVEGHLLPPVEEEEPPVRPNAAAGGDTPWARIKASISVYDFVRQYVPLQRAGSGYVGRCPFHDDRHPSFGVNVQGNYWNCFAGCGGGSLIDFWMRYRGVDFHHAVEELARMLLGEM